MNNNNDLNGIEEFADADSLDEVVEQPGLAVRRVVPPRHGGVEDNVPWTGGSPDPNLTRDYPMTPYCYRDVKTKKSVFARCEKGIGDDWIIKLKLPMPLATCEPQIQRGLEQVGVDSIFWVYNRRWINLFDQPDAVPIGQIRAHELALSNQCDYDRANLQFARVYLENSIDVDLHRKMQSQLVASDGGPAFWSILKRTLQGAEISKLMSHQKIINTTKLTDVAGYDLSKYHEVIRPSLTACAEASQLPLNVGPTIIKHHVGPQSLAYNSVLSTYAGEQAQLYDTNTQYTRLNEQMDSLLEVYLNDSDWEKVEAPKGAYMSGTKLTQADLREVKCYKCGKTGHIAKYCDGKAKKSGNKKKQSAGNAGTSEKKKKKWQNDNPDNETTKVKNGKTYKWCSVCRWSKGRWTDHDASTCPHRRKDATTEENNNDSDEAGLMVMDLVESGFLAINIV